MRIQFKETTVDLSPQVCRTIYRYVQHGNLPESGGILLGKYLPNESIYFVTEASTPSFWDKFGYTFFIRSKIIMIILGRKSCYIGIASAASNGENIEYQYIGEDAYALIFNR